MRELEGESVADIELEEKDFKGNEVEGNIGTNIRSFRMLNMVTNLFSSVSSMIFILCFPRRYGLEASSSQHKGTVTLEIGLERKVFLRFTMWLSILLICSKMLDCNPAGSRLRLRP